MSISEVNILNTRFTRDTKIDYKTENYAVSIWFARWDTDKSGDFNDAEWEQYQADIKKANERKAELEKVQVNQETVSIYTKILNNLSEKYKALEAKFNSIDQLSWDRLLEFEQNHPDIMRRGLAEGEELPQNAHEFDISSLEVGIYDEENDCFTGECYKKGCITGLETLNEEERKEYLSLLEASIKNANLLKKYVGEQTVLDQEYDKYFALQDMAENGVITEIPDQDSEEHLYQQYVNIRNNSNPFYKEIKDIEQKMTTLRLKGTKTDEDLRQIEQYQIQLQQLYNASNQWKLAYCSERPHLNEEDVSEEGAAQKLQITNLSGTVSYNDGIISENSSAGVTWNPNESLHASANIDHTIEFSGSDKDFSNTVNANAEIGYSGGNFNASLTGEVNRTPEMTTYTYGINTSFKNISANVGRTISSMEEGSVSTTNTSLAWNAGKYATTGSAEFTESGNTYSLASSANYNIAMGSSAKLSINPELKGSYNDETKDWMLSPTISLYSEIKTGRATVSLSASEAYVATLTPNSGVVTNHNFTATGNVEVKNWSFGAKFNDSDTLDSHSNTYGLNASYRTNNAGTISAGASHQITSMKGCPEKDKSTTFTLSFAAPLEKLVKLFGKK